MKRLIQLLVIFALTGCSEKKSNDALETFKYWAGEKPPNDLKLIEGQYWQSTHWSKEYIMYLKFKPTKIWWDEFLKENYIQEHNDEWPVPTDAPSWFKPSGNPIRYGIRDDLDQGSRYFRDTTTGISYIYEIQL